MQSQLLFKREGKTILPKPFAYYNASYSESEENEKVESFYEIEDEVHSDPDLNLVPTPNPRPKWAQKATEEARNMTGEPFDIRRTRSQFQKR